MKTALRLLISSLFLAFFIAPAEGFTHDILLRPGAIPVVITKISATDCRVVRGFYGVPVDGSVRSWDYRGEVAEYPDRASDGVHYSFNNNDGVHITLRNGLGFDAVILRG